MIAPGAVGETIDRAGFGPVREASPDRCRALGAGPLPQVAPREPAEVAACLRFAAGEGLACVPVGAGTELFLGAFPRRVDFLLSTENLVGIVEYPVGDLTLTARAGTPLGVLVEAAAAHRHDVPLEPPGGGFATLGGVLAAASDGPRRLAIGRARDQILGLSVALPDGTIARGGGRLVKNVTGYDLPRLQVGALGTLGVIVEATIRLRPTPRAAAASGVALFELDQAAPFLRAVRAGPFRPASLDLLDPDAARHAFGAEFGDGWLVLARFEGEPAAVDAQTAGLRALAVEKGGRFVPFPSPERAVVENPRTIAGGSALAWLRASTVPSMIAAFVERARREAASAGLPLRCLARAGVGTIHLLVPEGNARELLPLVGALREVARGFGASFVVVDAPSEARRAVPAWGDAPGGMAVQRRLRAAFDPAGTISPGRFVEGL